MKQIRLKLPRLTVTRRFIQIALGSLWLLDGLLQLQHQMFTSHFATLVIDPATVGQPRFVSGPMHFNEHLFLLHPAIFNGFIALAQLALGAAILWRRTARIGLLASAAWAMFVWVVGEGYGGIFGNQASILMGAPGAALFYLILALALLPLPLRNFWRAPDDADQPAAYWLIFFWSLLWFGGVFWQLTTSGMDTTAGLKAMINGNASDAPHWLSALDRHAANLINTSSSTIQPMNSGQHMSAMQMAQMPVSHGTGGWLIPALALLMLFISLGVYVGRRVRKVALILGCLFAFIIWVVGQNLGEYYTGVATDPNSGPLIILLGIALYGNSRLGADLKRLTDRMDGTSSDTTQNQ
jgi:hypothetical protein